MKITRTSPISGKVNTMEINVTEEEIQKYYDGAGLIQELLPNVSPDEREFIKSGITPDEYENLFGDEA
jgi:hypothetical protein